MTDHKIHPDMNADNQSVISEEEQDDELDVFAN